MVHPHSLRIPRVRRYSGYRSLASAFTYVTLTRSGPASHPVRLASTLLGAVLTPRISLPAVWPLPLSLATTRGISFDFSSSGYLDVSVPRVPRITLCVHVMLHGSSPCVFPHSEICGSKLICSSPQLIAACHVLHRLPMPRHSPYALLRLNYLRISVSGILVLFSSNRCVYIFAVFWQNCSFTQRKNLIFQSCFPAFLSCSHINPLEFI